VATLVTLTALGTALVNGVAAAWAGWRWWRVAPDRVSWVLIRAGQAAAVLLALAAGAARLADFDPEDGLFWLYAVLPVGVGVFAEQFRLLSAQTVLDARGLEGAEAMRALPDREQRSIVLAIVRRELGVMALAAGVVAFLALRGLGEI
jgi:hypothetical protein